MKLVQFDCCRTVFDDSLVANEIYDTYIKYVYKYRNEGIWTPLKFPKHWEDMKAHPDAAEGIDNLRAAGYKCVALSNWPSDFTRKVSDNNGIKWDGIVPLESIKAYKTDQACYILGLNIWRVAPPDSLMVTANKSFGDIEASTNLGMHACLIRDEEANCKDILGLEKYIQECC